MSFVIMLITLINQVKGLVMVLAKAYQILNIFEESDDQNKKREKKNIDRGVVSESAFYD